MYMYMYNAYVCISIIIQLFPSNNIKHIQYLSRSTIAPCHLAGVTCWPTPHLTPFRHMCQMLLWARLLQSRSFRAQFMKCLDLTSATHLISAYVQTEPILRAQVLGRIGLEPWAQLSQIWHAKDRLCLCLCANLLGTRMCRPLLHVHQLPFVCKMQLQTNQCNAGSRRPSLANDPSRIWFATEVKKSDEGLCLHLWMSGLHRMVHVCVCVCVAETIAEYKAMTIKYMHCNPIPSARHASGQKFRKRDMAYRNSGGLERNELKWNEMHEMNELTWVKRQEWFDMKELKRMNWNEWIVMSDLKWKNWNEGLDMNELKRINRHEQIKMKGWKHMNWNAWIDMKDLTWINWNEWIDMNKLKWRNGNAWIDMSELKRMNWHEWLGMTDLEWLTWKEGIETNELN